ncbi:MAG: DegT/DnrJ/EryC1/StrS family aminotransferase [Acidobacteriota bacterium]|jgi:dTDP-4-amino-4,6-dideoxygalactose transaminase
MSVPLLDLRAQHATIRAEVEAAVHRVMDSQHFILGEEVAAFEREVADRVGAAHAIGVASGTDALLLALRAVGIASGQEVVVPTFTFFATAGAVINAGGRPVFVDIEPRSFNLDPGRLEEALTERTGAIIAVHLFGQCADMEPILGLAAARGIPVIEDAAQAIGARYRERPAGSMGSEGCFSFFPSKNLGGYGDGGLVATGDPDLAARVRRLRVHGQSGTYLHQEVGFNSRLDALQAAVLRVKLRFLDGWAEGRRRNAERYREAFRAAGLAVEAGGPVGLPEELPDRYHVYNQFVIRVERRDALQAWLKERGIGTAVYYPLPLHRQECFADLGQGGRDLPVAQAACREVLALPVFPELAAAQQDEVVDDVCAFYAEAR